MSSNDEYFLLEKDLRLLHTTVSTKLHSSFMLPRLLSMKICLAFHDRVLFLSSHSTLRIHPGAESLFLTTSLSTLERTTEGFQNQSLSTARLCIIRRRESNPDSTTSSFRCRTFVLRAFPVSRMRQSLSCLPLQVLLGPLLPL